MYIPEYFNANNDKEEVFDFLNANSFGTIITAENNFPVATHLPFVIEKSGEKLILSSHCARANTQWQQFANNQVLVIFTGPHAYISPQHYNSPVNVPTWNYVSVHLYGNVRIISDHSATLAILEKMIMSFEKDYIRQWKSLPETYKNNMIKEITAFEIDVTEIQAAKKLSQNKKPEEKQRIINTLKSSMNSSEIALAELMEREKNRNIYH